MQSITKEQERQAMLDEQRLIKELPDVEGIINMRKIPGQHKANCQAKRISSFSDGFRFSNNTKLSEGPNFNDIVINCGLKNKSLIVNLSSL